MRGRGRGRESTCEKIGKHYSSLQGLQGVPPDIAMPTHGRLLAAATLKSPSRNNLLKRHRHAFMSLYLKEPLGSEETEQLFLFPRV
jgi:hypothetical protein